MDTASEVDAPVPITSVLVPLRAVDPLQTGAISVVLAALAVVGIGLNAALVGYLVLAGWLAVVARFDLATKRIPDVLNLATLASTIPLLVIASTADLPSTSLVRAGLGALVAFLAYLLLAVATPSGIGLGDVKLSPVLGAHLAFVSWPVLLWGLLGAFLGFSLVVGILLMFGVVQRTTRVPFGPFMVAAAFLAVAMGGPGL